MDDGGAEGVLAGEGRRPTHLRTSVVLSRLQADQLASAFELTRVEVLADAASVSAWSDSTDDLYCWLTKRHQWRTDEAPYYVRWLRLHRCLRVVG